MTAKEILFRDKSRMQIALGVDALANLVKVTLGPRGGTVFLDQSWGSPTISKDGKTVANTVELEDRFANMGAQMVKEVASKTSDVAGDGTTTATLLAQAIYTQGARLISAGLDPMELKRGIDAAVDVVVGELKLQSKSTKDPSEIKQVAMISSNGDEIVGQLLAKAMHEVGNDGVITIEEASSMETTLEVVEGMQLERGYLSPYFVTDVERMEVVLLDPFILLHEKRISSMADILPVLELVAETGKPLLILAEDVDGEALATLVVNNLRSALQVCAVKAPSYGTRRTELLEDVATLTGGKAITSAMGLTMESLTLQDLGRARKVTIDKDKTVLVDGKGAKEAIEARVKQLRAQIEDTTSDSDRDKLRERLAKVAGGVAVLKIGAATESEMKERKARVEDALHATRAAIEEGIVPGGGVALIRALPALHALKLEGDRQFGVDIVRRAIEEPLRQIAQNGGHEGAVVVDAVRRGVGAYGFNAATNVYEDLVAAGVIDPTKVVRVALQNAASVASVMLTTGAMIAALSDAPNS